MSKRTRDYWTSEEKRQIAFRVPALIITLVVMLTLTYLLGYTAISTISMEFDYMLTEQFVSVDLIVISILLLAVIFLMWWFGIKYRKDILRDGQVILEGILWIIGGIGTVIFSGLMLIFMWIYDQGVQPLWIARLHRWFRKIRAHV